MKIRTQLLFICLLSSPAFAQWHLYSPDSTIKVSVGLTTYGEPNYEIESFVNGQTVPLLSSSFLGIKRNDCDFRNGLVYVNSDSASLFDNYSLTTGKRLHIESNFIELNLTFIKCSKLLKINFRAYNDGVAFRYEFPEVSANTYSVEKEKSEFKIAATGSAGWMQPNINQFPVYEQLFDQISVGQTNTNSAGWTFPALLSVNSHWLFLTESDLDSNYFASHISGDVSNGIYKLEPPMLNDGTSYSNQATFKTPMKTPWRVIGIGSTLNEIVETNIVTNLASPAVISDSFSIEPGVATFSWWSNFSSSRYVDSMKHYVDLASELGYPYFMIDAYWDDIDNVDLAIPEFVEYSNLKDVKLWVWYNAGGSHNLGTYAEDITPRDRMHIKSVRQAEFQKLKDWGIVGVKVDFFMSDKQHFIQLYMDILKDAAEVGLMVNFHGCTAPRGWQRTYPHLWSMEAVAGGEGILFSSNFAQNVANHSVNLVFTRNILGSMDYTPGVVGYTYHNNGNALNYNATTSHELALISLFESGIVHLADHYSRYNNLPLLAKLMISNMPTAWDETKLIQGYPGDYVVLARRKGLTWYVSGVNGKSTSKTVTFGPEFLKTGKYKLRTMADGASASELSLSETNYQTGSDITMQMVPYGGFTLIFEPSCLDQLNVSGLVNFYEIKSYQAAQIEMSGKHFPYSFVESTAENSILLTPPFTSESGSTFLAQIGNCPF